MTALFVNNAYSTLASGITAGATTITLTATEGARFPSPTGADYFYMTLIDTSNNLEIVKVTTRSTDTLTVVRAQEGTTAAAYSAGDRVELRVTAAGLTETVAASAASAVSTAADAVSTAADVVSTAATYDLFDARYLGAKATDPTLDNDGNALLDGAMYFDTTLNITKIYDLGTTAWLRTTPTVAEQTNIDTVAGISSNVTTVAGISGNITTVAGVSADTTTVAGISGNVTTVAGISANTTTVAGISAGVTTVAAIDTKVTTVAGISSNVTTVAGISANTTTVAGISTDVTTVAGIAPDVSAVAAQIVGWNFSTTTTMADPGAGIIRFNNATPASVTAIAVDDLDSNAADVSTYVISWDDSTNTNKGTLTVRQGTSFAIFTITALTDNVGWSQLAVTYVTGSGSFADATLSFSEFVRSGDKGADGSGTGDMLAANNLSDVVNAATSLSNLGGLANLVEDLTPQLGGNLDLNGNLITGLVIGTDVLAYNANTLFADTDDILNAGFAGADDDDGTQTTGTYTPIYTGGNFKKIVNGGAFTLAPQVNTSTLIVQMTNNASAGALTTSGYTIVTGDTVTTTNADDFMLYSTVVNAFKHLHVVALQ